jgi:hypothetical protein
VPSKKKHIDYHCQDNQEAEAGKALGIAHYKFQFKKAGQRLDLEGIWPVQAPF